MAKTSTEYSKQLRKNIDNFSLQDSLKRVAKENEIAAKLQSTSNVLSQEEQDLYNQTIHDRDVILLTLLENFFLIFNFSTLHR